MNTSLTMAYLVIGAMQAWNEASEEDRSRVTDHYEGQFAYVDAAMSHTHLLAKTWRELADSGKQFDGVWVYEVAEPFGLAWGRAQFSGEDFDPFKVVKQLTTRSNKAEDLDECIEETTRVLRGVTELRDRLVDLRTGLGSNKEKVLAELAMESLREFAHIFGVKNPRISL